MSFKNLHEFIARLEAEGELVRIRTQVSPILEITEFADRISKSPEGGKALLFENVEGSAFPVVINAFGSPKRIALALGADPDVLAHRLKEILDQGPPRSLIEKLKLVPKAVSWSRFFPVTKRMKTPACQEVIHIGDDVDLSALPILQCWPKDGGRFITLPLVITKGLYDGRRNVGMYRMQVHDRNTTGMHWHIHKDGSHHYHEYKKAGKKMEVAVVIGTDPATTYAATAPMPRGVDEMILAGFIRQKPLVLVKGITVDIEVPAEAEFVLEGYVEPGRTRTEGPFGDHTGYYSLEDEYPVFHVTAITHRRKPVYSATVVGRPPMEDCYLALATQRLFLPMIKTVLPEIKDYTMPWEGVFHNIVVVAMEKEYPRHAAKMINALWGLGQMSFAKAIVIIDDEQLLTNREGLLRHILDTMDAGEDVTMVQGVLDVLDHSAPQPLYGSKIGMDATKRMAGEPCRTETVKAGHRHNDRSLLKLLREIDAGFVSIRSLFEECRNPLTLISIEKDARRNSRYYINHLNDAAGRLTNGMAVLYDADIDITDNSLVLWKAFNNIDPARDISITPDIVIIDATRKMPNDGHDRPWPDDIEMTHEIKELVSKKMKELALI